MRCGKVKVHRSNRTKEGVIAKVSRRDQIYWPPSTFMTSPVICLAFSDAGNTMTFAKSSGWPTRFKTISFKAISTILSRESESHSMAVSIKPGATAFTLTLNAPSFLARALVNPIMKWYRYSGHLEKCAIGTKLLEVNHDNEGN